MSRCAALIEAGISLAETVEIILHMEKIKKNIKILEKIKSSIEKGISFSKSLTLSEGKFENNLISIISYGESAGTLPLSLRQATINMEKKDDLKRKIVGALIYPAFIAMATLGMALFLVLYIFPKIIPLLSSMNIALPLMTRALRKVYLILSEYGIWIALIIVILSAIFYLFFKIKNKFRNKIQIFLLISPILGELIIKYTISNFSRSIGTLLEYGQSLPDILEHASRSTSLIPYTKALRICKEEVIRGVSLSESMSSFKTIFPPLMIDMIAIGEKTGLLSTMFKNIVHIYEEELDYFIKKLGTAIEPILMILMGLVVGSIALSIILPIYEITNHLGR